MKNNLIQIWIILLLISALLYFFSKNVALTIFINFLFDNIIFFVNYGSLKVNKEGFMELFYMSLVALNNCLAVIISLNFIFPYPVLQSPEIEFTAILLVIIFINIIQIIIYPFCQSLHSLDYNKNIFAPLIGTLVFVVGKIILVDVLVPVTMKGIHSFDKNVWYIFNLGISIVLARCVFKMINSKVDKLLFYSLVMPHIILDQLGYFICVIIFASLIS